MESQFKRSKLNWSNVDIDMFPSELFFYRNLKKLNLSFNKIKRIPVEFNKLFNLETLDLSNNRISFLYSKFCDLGKLEILILNNNKLTALPKQINRFQRLKILSLSGNKLNRLPDEIAELQSLEELNIGKNNFTSFPECLLQLKNLKRLWLNNNYLESFPTNEIVMKMISLEGIYCYGVRMDQFLKINKDFLLLAKHKGNSLSILKTLTKKTYTVKNESIKIDNQTEIQKRSIDKIKIFISYSHEDLKYLERVQIHFKVLSFENRNFDIWDDTKLVSGQDWKEEIEKSIETCQIAILLISTDFMASDFIRKYELPTIISRVRKKGVKILPLIVGYSKFNDDPILSKIQAVNHLSEPLYTRTPAEVDQALIKLTNDVSNILNTLLIG